MPSVSTIIFNGTSSIARTNSSSILRSIQGTQPFTIEIWFKINTYPSSQYIISAIAEQGNQAFWDKAFRLFPDGSISFYLYNGTERHVRSNPGYIELNRWYHVAGSYDGSIMRLYIDGVQVNQTSANGSYNFTNPVHTFGHIVASGVNSSVHFHGELCEYRLWSTIRTEDQIIINKNHRLRGNEKGLLLYYKTDEGQGNALNDASSSGINSNLTNITWGSVSEVILGGYYFIWSDNSHYAVSFDEDGEQSTGLVRLDGELNDRKVSSYGVRSIDKIDFQKPFTAIRAIQSDSTQMGSGKVFEHSIDSSRVQIKSISIV